MRNKKFILFIILGLILAVVVFFGIKFGLNFINQNNEPENPTDNPSYVPKEEETLVDSYLFRDNVIGQSKDIVNVVDVIEENILGFNFETNYVYNSKGVLMGFISTLVPPDGEDFDYARNFQSISAAISESTGTIATSIATWTDGKEYAYSTKMWNRGLANGSLSLQATFSTHQGELVLIGGSELLDASLERPASQKTFITLIVGDKNFIKSYTGK